MWLGIGKVVIMIRNTFRIEICNGCVNSYKKPLSNIVVSLNFPLLQLNWDFDKLNLPREGNLSEFARVPNLSSEMSTAKYAKENV